MNFNFGHNTTGQAGETPSKQDGFQSQLDNWGSGNHSGSWGGAGASSSQSSAADLFRAPTAITDVTSTTTTSTITTSTTTTTTSTVESGSESDAQDPSQAKTAGKKRRRTTATKKAPASKKATKASARGKFSKSAYNFEEWKVKDLQEILHAHGLKKGGVKAELIERCRLKKVHLVAPMKLVELQAQLVTRGLKKTGSKKELRSRLIEAMNPKPDNDADHTMDAPPAKKRKLNPRKERDSAKGDRSEKKKSTSTKKEGGKKKKSKKEKTAVPEPERKAEAQKSEPKKSAIETSGDILAAKLKSMRQTELDNVLLKMAKCDYGLCGGCANCGKGPSK